MSRTLTTLPLPLSLAARYVLAVHPVRAALVEAGPQHVFGERGERLLGVRNAPPTVKAAVGLAEMRGYRHALVAGAGDIIDYRAAFTVLEPHLQTHVLPLFPGDAERTARAGEPVLRAVGDGETGPNLDVRMLARSLDAQEERQLRGALPSAEWRRLLLGLLHGAAPALPQPDAGGEERARVALLGHLAGPPEILDYIEVFGGRVVYEEWLQCAVRIALAAEPWQALATSPLVGGVDARIANLEPILDRVDAIVAVVEPFCALALDEAWMRGALRKPLLVLEVESLAHLDATRVMRLENFAEMAFRKMAGGGAQ